MVPEDNHHPESVDICIGAEVGIRLRGDLDGTSGHLHAFGLPAPTESHLLHLEVTREPVPDGIMNELLFDSTGLWKVYRNQREYIFELPHLCAVVDFDRSEGRIHLLDSRCARFVFDYPLDEVLFSRLLAERDAVIVHACGVEHDGGGLLFPGNSGAGKSTMASLFDDREGACVLSDDRVVLWMRAGRPWISGTPWHGTSGHAQDRSVPLRAIFHLHHARENGSAPMTPLVAAARLTSLCVVPFWHRDSAVRTVDAAAHAAGSIPSWSLGFSPGPGVIRHIIDTLGRASS